MAIKVAQNTVLSKIRKVVTSKSFLKWALGTLGVILLIMLINWYTIPEAMVTRAVRGTAEELVIGSVEVSEYHSLQLRSERHGIVLESFVEIGDTVSKGQVLMRLDTDDQQLELERLMIEKENFEKNLEIKHQSEYTHQKLVEELEDIQRDVNRGIRPQRELELAQRELQKLEDDMQRVKLNQDLNLTLKENQIKQLRLDIEKMTIRSPVDGVITDIQAREGDLVSAEAVIFELIDSRRLVVAEISEEDYNKVKEGMNSTVRFLAYPDEIFKATVSQILPTANPITQRYKAYLDVTIDNDRLTPGLTGEVSVVAARREHAVLVPSQAVLGNHVFKVTNSRISSTRVEIGYRGLVTVEIIEGLREGDIVVLEELTRFKNGDLVRLNWGSKSGPSE